MLPLRGGAAVFRANCPAVFGIDDAVTDASVDHGFDREGHAGHEGDFHVIVVVGNLGRLMKGYADTVADKLIHDGTFVGAGVFFDLFGKSAKFHCRAYTLGSMIEALERYIHDEFFFIRDFADGDHTAAIAKKSVDNAGGVDVENVAFLQGPLVRDTMANHFG